MLQTRRKAKRVLLSTPGTTSACTIQLPTTTNSYGSEVARTALISWQAEGVAAVKTLYDDVAALDFSVKRQN